MTATLNLTTATPADIDAAWAEAVAPAHAKLDKVAALRARATQMVRRNRNEEAEELDDQANILAERAHDELKAVSAPFKAEWDNRGGWTRAYKVQGGHVHSHTNCSSCHKMGQRTELYWVTKLSGLNMAEIAKLAGDAACTICYPEAPVSRPTEIFTPAERKTAAEREERAAALVAKKADAASKSITDVDGSPLKGKMGYAIIATERTARIELTDALHEVMLLHGPYMIGREDANLDDKAYWAQMAIDYSQYAERLADAIAAKTGLLSSDIIDEHQLKADKKWAKSLKEWDASPHNPANQ